MTESRQHWLSRNRPPRVQITYDVELGDAIEMKELPFVVGIMSDLSGKRAEPLPALKDRKFVEIDRDNFEAVMESINPRLAVRVADRLSTPEGEGKEPGNLNAELTFTKMEDFEPVAVVQQVKPMRELFEARRRLADLLGKLDGNDELEALLADVVDNPESQKALREVTKKAEADQGATPTPTPTPDAGKGGKDADKGGKDAGKEKK